jgi:hypothetical protein
MWLTILCIFSAVLSCECDSFVSSVTVTGLLLGLLSELSVLLLVLLFLLLLVLILFEDGFFDSVLLFVLLQLLLLPKNLFYTLIQKNTIQLAKRCLGFANNLCRRLLQELTAIFERICNEMCAKIIITTVVKLS